MTMRKRGQKPGSAAPTVMAWRLFSMDEGWLRSPLVREAEMMKSPAWRPGINQALCPDGHRPPGAECHCGIYGCRSLKLLLDWASRPQLNVQQTSNGRRRGSDGPPILDGSPVLAKVRLSGRVLPTRQGPLDPSSGVRLNREGLLELAHLPPLDPPSTVRASRGELLEVHLPERRRHWADLMRERYTEPSYHVWPYLAWPGSRPVVDLTSEHWRAFWEAGA